MKKGCFIKGIFILTIVTGVIVYLVQNNFQSYFVNPGKKLISNMARKGFANDLVTIKDSPEKDSVKILIDDFFKNKFTKFNTYSDKMFEPLATSIEKFSKDSLLDKNELNTIKIILDSIEDEGSKKD